MARAVPEALRAARSRAYLRRAARKTGADRLAALGAGSLIAPPATILSPHRIEVGSKVLIHENAMLSVVEEYNGRRHEPRLRIGDGTNIGRGVWISCVGSIDIGARVLAGHNILIADSYHEYHDPDRPIIEQPMAEPKAVRIGSGCILGPHVAVLAGVTLGDRSFVAANAVVTRDVPPNSVVVGNPARVLRRYDRDAGAWVDVGADDRALPAVSPTEPG